MATPRLGSAPGGSLDGAARDGRSTIVAGAVGDNTGAGSVYTFDRSGAATRTQTGKLTASDGADQDTLGVSVDIDGDTVVAGAPGADLGETYDAGYGAVSTFASTGAANRTQTATLTASDNVIAQHPGRRRRQPGRRCLRATSSRATGRRTATRPGSSRPQAAPATSSATRSSPTATV